MADIQDKKRWLAWGRVVMLVLAERTLEALCCLALGANGCFTFIYYLYRLRVLFKALLNKDGRGVADKQGGSLVGVGWLYHLRST